MSLWALQYASFNFLPVILVLRKHPHPEGYLAGLRLTIVFSCSFLVNPSSSTLNLILAFFFPFIPKSTIILYRIIGLSLNLNVDSNVWQFPTTHWESTIISPCSSVLTFNGGFLRD